MMLPFLRQYSLKQPHGYVVVLFPGDADYLPVQSDGVPLLLSVVLQHLLGSDPDSDGLRLRWGLPTENNDSLNDRFCMPHLGDGDFLQRGPWEKERSVACDELALPLRFIPA